MAVQVAVAAMPLPDSFLSELEPHTTPLCPMVEYAQLGEMLTRVAITIDLFARLNE